MIYKVLIIEDEEMIRKGLRYSFNWSKEDCIVVGEASNGLDGLNKIEELEPHIIIVDITMPIMDGITMIEKSHDKFIYSSIIISGYDEFEFAKKAIKFGVSEYLLKPVDPKQLLNALNKAKREVKIRMDYESIKNISVSIEDIDILNIDFLSEDFKGNHYVLNMIEYINDNYAKKISINDLVEPLGKSSTYLNQKFKEQTTYTFNDFLNRFRIKKSIEFMKTGEGKIYTIANDVGFSDYRYFITVFKKYTNRLPSDFLEYFRHSSCNFKNAK